MKKHLSVAITSLALVGALAASGTAFAAELAPSHAGGHFRGGEPGRGMMSEPNRAPGVFGIVASVSGNTLTITSKGFGKDAAAKTYTVDATNATVFKDNATSSVSAIAAGDTVMAQGTISGTSVTAKIIHDGMPGSPNGEPRGMMGAPSRAPGMQQHATGTPENIPVIKGDGKPVVGGIVTTISGNTLTITNKSGVTYTIDATAATIVKQGTASTVSAVVTGDEVIAQGTVTGSAVTATSIQDQGAAPTLGTAGTSTTATPQPPHRGAIGGMFNAVGTFFHRMFGFF